MVLYLVFVSSLGYVQALLARNSRFVDEYRRALPCTPCAYGACSAAKAAGYAYATICFLIRSVHKRQSLFVHLIVRSCACKHARDPHLFSGCPCKHVPFGSGFGATLASFRNTNYHFFSV